MLLHVTVYTTRYAITYLATFTNRSIGRHLKQGAEVEGKLTCRGLGHSSPDTYENLRIIWQKIIGSFTFVML